jgi:hypothetical protein
MRMLGRLTRLVFACYVLAAGAATADPASANTAAVLRAKYTALSDQLNRNQFHRPLYLDSSQSSSDLKGDIYVLVDYPFATADAGLKEAAHWCDILILHINIKYCRASAGKSTSVLTAYVGKKYDEPLASTYRVDFVHRVTAEAADYLQILLNADTGPFNTTNYRIMLEAIPLENRQTFIHLSYSYAYGLMAKLAMQAYLSTFGSGKVGFTVIGQQPDGRPEHVRGMRGVVERNTMRYYLAIDAYLGALSSPPHEQLEKRLRDWFMLTERYPRQLHELEQNDYLVMKRKEYVRQRTEG